MRLRNMEFQEIFAASSIAKYYKWLLIKDEILFTTKFTKCKQTLLLSRELEQETGI